MKPKRIQLARTKGFRKPTRAIVVSRPTKWGNPHRPEDHGGNVVFAVTAFSVDLVEGRLKVSVEDVRRELRGKDLACWCPLPKPGQLDHCHAAVLIQVANS